MTGIPWAHLKDALSQLGHLPLLGWPDDIDPMTCVFTYQGDRATAIKAQVVVARWDASEPEWVDLR